MMRTIRELLMRCASAAAVAALLLPEPAAGQTPLRFVGGGVAVGVADLAGPAGSGPAFGGSLRFERGDLLVAVRALSASEFTIFTDPAEQVHEAGVLVGRRTGTTKTRFAATGGIAVVGGVRRGEPVPARSREFDPVGGFFVALFESSQYHREPFVTVGVPVEAQATWAPWAPHRSIALEATAFVNVNAARSFAGAMIGVQLGRSHP